MRSDKISAEKYSLQMQTSKGNENLMNEKTYRKIVAKINQIRGLYDKKRAKAANQTADPITQIVEIEAHINKVLKFLQLVKIADAPSVKQLIQVQFTEAKGLKQQDVQRLEEIKREKQEKEVQQRKMRQVHVTGIRKDCRRSEKPRKKQHKIERQEQTSAERAIQKYLGMQLDDEENKQQQ